MGLPKGRTNNLNGRPTGSKGVKTLAWEQLGDFFTTEGAQRAKDIMMNSKDKEFMDHYKNLIELFKPKLARTELTGIGGEDLTLNITRTVISKKI